MSLSAEAWLVLLALAIYVYDAALLLNSNEFVGVRVGRNGWRCRFGANGWKLNGREPWWPNLLMPWREAVLVHWSFEEVPHEAIEPEEGARADGMHELAAPAAIVKPSTKTCVATLLALIFLALPFCLFVYSALWLTVCVAGLIYGLAILIMILLHSQRIEIGLKKERFWKLCVECVACPPLAINAIRKATLGVDATTSAAVFAEWISDEAELREMKHQMVVRVREQMDFEAEGSERMTRLAAVAVALAPERPLETMS